jgi:cytochrome c oxidase subunit 1
MTGWLILLYNIISSWRRGEVASANPWHAKSLEWHVPTPVPLENFLVDPVVTSDPYGYGEPAVEPVSTPEPAVVGSSSTEEGTS